MRGQYYDGATLTLSYLSLGYYAGLVASSMFIGRIATWFVKFFVQIPLTALKGDNNTKTNKHF